MHDTLKYKLIRTEFPKVRDLGPTRKRRYQVDARPHYGRKCFLTIGEAKAYAGNVAVELRKHGTEAFELTSEERSHAIAARAKLRPFHKTLDDAVNFYATHLQREKIAKQSPTVSAALDRYLESRKADVVRGEITNRTLIELRCRAEQLRSALGGLHLNEVDGNVLRNFLNSLPVAAQTRLGIKLRASRFWNWCIEQKLTDHNPASEIKIKVQRGDVVIMTVDQAKQLLKAALDSNEPGVIAWFAIACFGGCRPTEITRMDFSAINFNTKTITVLGNTSKVKETRYVPLSDTLRSWLLPIATSGPVIGNGNFQGKWRAVVNAAEMRPWTPDICRHSFGSFWLGLHKNRAELAEIMGNSVDVIKKHYRAPVLESDAAAYFALTPDEVRRTK